MLAFPVTVRSTDKTQSLALRATPRELNAAPNGQYAKKQIRTTSQVGWWAVCSCERAKQDRAALARGSFVSCVRRARKFGVQRRAEALVQTGDARLEFHQGYSLGTRSRNSNV
jgi:hypothetical protein